MQSSRITGSRAFGTVVKTEKKEKMFTSTSIRGKHIAIIEGTWLKMTGTIV